MRNRIKPSGWRNIGIICGLCLLMAAIVAFVQPQAESAQTRLYWAIFFQCLIVGAILLLCIRAAYGWLLEIGYKKRDMLWIGCWSLVLAAAVLVFLYFYFRNEKDIKVYDFSLYWIRVIEYREVIADSIPNYLQRVLASLSNEYSTLPAFALQPASYLFGTSFTGYVQSIFVMYYFPASFFLTVFSMRLVPSFRSKTPSALVFTACLTICVLTPVFFLPVMQGYLDVVGVLVMSIMLNVALRWDGRAISIRRNVTLALLSVLLLLLRRWYAYYIVGFYFAIGLVVLIDALTGKKNVWKSIRDVLLNLLMIALLSVGLIFLLNRDVFTLFLSNDYGQAYSAYKVTSSLEDITVLIAHTGYLWMLVAFAGFCLLIGHRQSRSAGLRLLIAMLVAGGLFLAVQSLGHHHRYLLLPTILCFIMVSIAFILEMLTVKQERIVSGALALLCCANMTVAFVPHTNVLGLVTWGASTRSRLYPVQNQYYDIFRQIVSDLGAKTGGKVASVYMLGENVIGPEYLRRIDLPNQTDAAPFLSTNSIVDLRDGFPSQLFFADYVLVPDPLTNTLSDVQQISYQVYDMFLNDPIITDYYDLETVYRMEDTATLNLYHKTKATDRALVDHLKERLLPYYPDTPLVYQPIYFLALSSFDTSMQDYNFYAKELSFVAGPDDPASFMVHDTGSFAQMSFVLRANAPGFDLVVENQTGEIYRSNIEMADTEYRMDVSGSINLRVSMVPQEPTGPEGWFTLRFQEDSLR